MSQSSTNPTVEKLIELLENLESLLGREFQAILNRERDTLTTLTDAKQGTVDDITLAMRDLDDEVRELINDRNSPTGRRLIDLIRLCANANKTNGCAIESSQSFTVSLLDILKGRAPGERVYTSRGRLGLNERTTSSGFISV